MKCYEKVTKKQFLYFPILGTFYKYCQTKETSPKSYKEKSFICISFQELIEKVHS